MILVGDEAKEKGRQIRLAFPANGDHPGIEVTDIPNRWQYYTTQRNRTMRF